MSASPADRSDGRQNAIVHMPVTRSRTRMGVGVVVVLLGAALGLSSFAVRSYPGAVRIVLASLLAGTLVAALIWNPRRAVLLTLGFLPMLALIRRLLIPLAGWTSYDALLVVAPIVSIFLIHRLFVLEKRPIAGDGLSRLVLCLLGLTIFEAFNPAGASLGAGITGLLFLAAPLVWFFVGRELANREVINAVLVITVLEGVGIALYGLWQVGVAFPSWDAAWIRFNGYAALDVALGSTRAFGTFSSAAEYATYLAVALVIVLVIALHRRPIVLLILPVLGYALFLESSRGIIVFALLAMVVVAGLRSGSLRLTLVATVLAVGGAVATVHFLGPQLTAVAQRSGNPLITHQVAGLANPLDPERSTFLAHYGEAFQGVLSSLNRPWGLGTAATNIAGNSAGTEFDLSNAFVSLGLVGGVLFAATLVATFWRVVEVGLTNRNVATLAVVGLLIVTFGQWLNGGYYAVAPLIWFLVGWSNQQGLARQQVEEATRRVTTGTPRWAVARQSSTGEW